MEKVFVAKSGAVSPERHLSVGQDMEMLWLSWFWIPLFVEQIRTGRPITVTNRNDEISYEP